MPVKFSVVCELLIDLEKVVSSSPRREKKTEQEEQSAKIDHWFRCHRSKIDAPHADGAALLSTLFPEKRTDRVYSLKEASLLKVVARCLCLNQFQRTSLKDWNTPGSGGLGQSLERILREFDCEAKPGMPVTIEEVDAALHALASGCPYSGLHVRSSLPSPSADETLGSIYKRLNSIEAKWLTRLILKNYSPVEIDYHLVTRKFHFLLPDLLQFQDSFPAAMAVLRGPLKDCRPDPEPRYRQLERANAAQHFHPQTGVKVGRQTYHKARSLKSCVEMCGKLKWSVERKYDGEFCEIHINLDKGSNCIQIFSKSNKDSTQDRKSIHGILRDRLRIGKADCAIKRKCILVGELVPWSEPKTKILDFYHIRKHVTRSGMFLGNGQDSQVQEGERLMMIFFDILMLDDEILLRKPYSERRERLKEVVTYKAGYAMPSERTIVDFSLGEEAQERLCLEFAAALSYRFEGLVLKPMDMPYFRLDYGNDWQQKGYVIKLKRDYLQELGGKRDVVDFAIIGASYDPKLAHKSVIGPVKFTTFHLGCCVNKERATRFAMRPVFEIVGMISLDQCIQKSELLALNNYGRFSSIPFERADSRLKDPQNFDLVFNRRALESLQLSVVFDEPCIVEVLGSGFERPSHKDYQMLRHPRILKVHHDRTWQDACSFTELQELACDALAAPEIGESQEMCQLFTSFMEQFRELAGRERRQSTQRTTRRTESIQSSLRSSLVRPSSGASSRRSPRKTTSPVLVRVDTSERRPGEPIFTSGGSPKGHARHISATESLPSPPPSSPTETPAKPLQAQKRPSEEDVSATDKRAKRNQSSAAQVISPTALSAISNNSNRRHSVRTREWPRSSGKVPSRTPKTSRNQNHVMSCHNPNCPFTKSVLFLTNCVSDFKWVSETLVSWHGAEHVSDLMHWSRDTIDVAPLGSVVAESYSYPDHQKIILVESNRLDATMAVVDQVKRMGIRDLVLFFDWRVMEEWKDAEAAHSQNFDALDARKVFEKKFFGFMSWSSERNDVVFMHRELAKMPRGWLEH